MATDLNIEDAIIAELLACEMNSKPQNTERIWTGQAGQQYIEDLLDIFRPAWIRKVLYMEIETFYILRDWLMMHTSLTGRLIQENRNRGERGGYMPISIEEKLMIFLYITTLAIGYTATADKFSRSIYSINR